MKRLIVIVMFSVIVVLSLGGLLWLVVEKHAKSRRGNPVEYYILHTSMTQTGDQLRNALVGEWKLVGAKSIKTDKFVVLDPDNHYFKTFTLTNWATVNYDSSSNVVNSASGPYTLSGDVCTETIEMATGSKRQFLGAHVPFRIRVVGDDYYQMGAGLHPSIEQQWHRIRE